MCLGDWPEEEAVLDGLDWYFKIEVLSIEGCNLNVFNPAGVNNDRSYFSCVSRRTLSCLILLRTGSGILFNTASVLS